MLAREDYESMADQVVGSFVSSKTPLNSSILKIAQENDFNPEQVKRLVEMSNVKAFLKVFNEREDKNSDVDFDVADSGAVMKDYYAPDKGCITITKVTMSMSPDGGHSDFESDIPDMTSHHRHKESKSEPTEKVAEEVVKTEPNYVSYQRLNKVAEQFYANIFTEEHGYVDGLEKISSEFRKDYGPDYAEFEKVALLVHGAEITPILDDVRKIIRWTQPIYDLEKVSGRQIVDDTTLELKTLASMVEHKKSQAKYAEALKIAKKKMKALSA